MTEKVCLLRDEFQNWLGSKNLTHRIDIEPSPSHPLTYQELCQRFRKILFDMNKRHLKKRSFPKWIPEDKFWLIGFKEGNVGIGKHQLHYHLLLHSPTAHSPDIFQDLQWGWMKQPSINQATGKCRPMIRKKKPTGHFGSEDFLPELPLRIERIRTKMGSVVYNSKEMFHGNYDDHFILGLNET